MLLCKQCTYAVQIWAWSLGIIKCVVLTIKTGQLVKSCGIEQPSGEKVSNPESTGLGILELDELMNKEMTEINYRSLMGL